ncbi:hypothetical protein XENTR_v10004618 [Xenopus tropicalis]|nr:hypothetical protein XENTR_v10004618 [Xenopus tropicalis]
MSGWAPLEVCWWDQKVGRVLKQVSAQCRYCLNRCWSEPMVRVEDSSTAMEVPLQMCPQEAESPLPKEVPLQMPPQETESPLPKEGPLQMRPLAAKGGPCGCSPSNISLFLRALQSLLGTESTHT